MNKIDVAYLHCHSCYSIQDAMPQLKDYVNTIYNRNQNSSKYNIVGFALTDHGVLHGITDQYRACNEPDFPERKTKALYGIEIYHCEDVDNNPNNDRFHMVLIAKDNVGLHNIYQIASHAGTHLICGRQKNFPTTDINFLKSHGKGIIASSACFTKGHKITTINGEKNIEDIVSGDLVITEDGSFQKVINPTSRKYCNTGYNLSFEKNGRDITCTKNHKFLIYDNKKKVTFWKEANKLKITDNCLFPIYKPKYTNISTLDISSIISKCSNKKYDSKRRKINVNIPITHELMRTIGLWLADGSVSYDDNKGYYRVDFTFGEKDFDIYYNNFVKNGMDLFGIEPNITRRPKYHRVDLAYNSKELAFVFKEIFGCTKANTKHVPNIFKTISEDYNYELLYGYLLGDGYFRYREKDGCPTGEITSATISKQLHCDILELYNLCGFAPSVRIANEKTDTNGVHHNESYYITLSCKDLTLKLNKENILNHEDLMNTIDKYRFSKNCFVNINDQFYLRKRINNIKTIFLDTNVYCMNVENNHSFVCNGIIVHNCLGGMIPKLITNGQYDEAEKYALLFNDIFDEFYLEVQPLEISEQLIVNDFLVKLSKKTGIPLIMTCDSHYINKSDAAYHDILKDIAHQIKFTEPCYLRTPEEMEEYCILHNIPLDCISNTGIVASHCNADPKPINNRYLLPVFPCPKGYTEDTYLRKLSFEELKKKLIKNKITNPTKYIKKMLYELDIICNAGYAGYFLILWDWFKWCRENDILMGPGRGSAAASIVSYVLNITKVDPIKNGFVFERFLNPGRLSFPDIDRILIA